ncbi:hypothetical protein CDG60_04250 [Acinetobacter chinensis]|jgi:hypothetical protein|uniref:Uncharacterized protein n=1 Tax=Acinetobacter chinensis TaxID=2004650 RepID=A0A3B7LZX1_9GAMM|nr:hypothetical protein [Acinetobacter chinensis]AXY55863.1 hypothetical protein CDG60_04250 [Acinetobacter chinensis]WOE42200.1 hypothetical protein QSG87_03395 [Acinetobacter chinensis]
MAFHHEVGGPFGLTAQQSDQLEQGLKALDAEFNQAVDVENDEFAQQYSAKFEQLTSGLGISEEEREMLISHLYFTEEFHDLVTYIVPAYYRAGGDREVYSDTYELMMGEMQLED